MNYWFYLMFVLEQVMKLHSFFCLVKSESYSMSLCILLGLQFGFVSLLLRIWTLGLELSLVPYNYSSIKFY